ncbi:hypothetical protein, partial [Thermosulfurimonas sp.]|uniref:hypothetical protein n=1 Tax=Thermosulfurimonas sp. TaxID=2080236 RepID=UPI0025D38181
RQEKSLPQKRATVSVVLPADFYRELKLRAAMEEKSLSSFLEQLLRIGFAEYERRKLEGLPPETLEDFVGLVEYEGDAFKDAEAFYEE